tara:strand:- start:65 stop:715 length:651 start_codon:yes stop_codon:yes gene_type:complete
MKILIILSGRLKSFDIHHKNILDCLVQDNQVDFIASISNEPINDDLIDAFKELYNPIEIIKSNGILFEPYQGWTNVKANKEMRLYKKNVAYMWKNRSLVNDYIKDDYDWIISTRVDVRYKDKLDYNALIEDAVNIPHYGDYGGYQDKIAIAKPKLIKMYLDLYNNMKEYLIKKPINPEPLLKYHCDVQNIPVHRMHLKCRIYPKGSIKQKAENYID